MKKLFSGILFFTLLLSGCSSGEVSDTPAGENQLVESNDSENNSEQNNGKNTDETESVDSNDEPSSSAESTSVHFIDVGQADATLIVAKDEVTLIDAGNNDDGNLVVNYISSLGINQIDYIVGTHPHEDHIGGLDDVINSFDIGEVFLPEFMSDTKTFEDVLDAIDRKGLEINVPEPGDTFGTNVTYQVLGPNRVYEDANNNSIVIQADTGYHKFMFTGDMETDAESDLLSNFTEIQSDVLKVGHHGSTTSTSNSFLNAVNPTYAVIHVGEGNDYGHPHDEIMSKLQNYGCSIYRTDQNGTIIMTSSANGLDIQTQENNGSLPPAVEEGNAGSQEQPEGLQYIGNVNSKKFHRSDCSGLPNENNRVYFDNREDAINQGYEPCQRCNP